MKGTLYIVPAWSSQAGQCRIVGYPGMVASARDCYQAHPELWKEVGLMNSRGELVCLSKQYGDAGGRAELKASEPLMAGLEFDVVLADVEEVACAS